MNPVFILCTHSLYFKHLTQSEKKSRKSTNKKNSGLIVKF